MFCRNCGKEIEDDAKFCAYCGKEIKSRSGADTDSRRQEKESEKVKKSRPKKILYILPGILIIVVAVAVAFFVMKKPKTDKGWQDSEVSSDSDEEDEEIKESREENDEEEMEEETEKEEPAAIAEQLRASLENCLRDLEIQYGYADLEARWAGISFEGDYNLDEWDVWTGISGIAKAKICDLDDDGWEELLVIFLEGKNIHLCVYEGNADMPSDVPVKRAEAVLERSSDIHNHEDICSIVDGNGVNYLLFLQAYWGGWGDGYYAQARLYQYNGTDLYTPITIQQEAEGSSEFVYFARRYEADGTMLSEEVIYDDTAQYGAYMEDDHCRRRMKELFGAYGIAIGGRAAIYIYDGNFDDFLAPEENSEELMKLRMWSYAQKYSMNFGFNDDAGPGGYILPGSDGMCLWVSDLEGMTQEECRLARNEIYARHGRIFEDPEQQDYFNGQGWYTGTIAPEDFSDDMLNDFEKYNLDVIAEYEEEMGYR